MELNKYIIIIIFINLTNFLYADIIQPAKNLTAYDVVKIQLTALKNNNKQSKMMVLNKHGYLLIRKIKNIQGPMKDLKK